MNEPGMAFCWRCLYEFAAPAMIVPGDRAKRIGPARARGNPAEGDIAICQRCGAVGIWGPGGGSVRQCDPVEELELMRRSDVLETVVALREAWGRGAR